MHSFSDSTASAIKRSFEALVTRHGVPENEAAVMAVLIQEGQMHDAIDVAALASDMLACKGSTALPEPVEQQLQGLLSSPLTLGASIGVGQETQGGAPGQAQVPAIDYAAAEQLGRAIRQLPRQREWQAYRDLRSAIVQMPARTDDATGLRLGEGTALRLAAFGLAVLLPFEHSQQAEELLLGTMQSVLQLQPSLQQRVIELLSCWPASRLEALVEATHTCLTLRYFMLGQDYNLSHDEVAETHDLMEFLRCLYAASQRGQVLPHSKFALDFLRDEDFDLPMDYQAWRIKRQGAVPGADGTFAFCEYPFVWGAASKADVLALECYGEQRENFERALFGQMIAGRCPYLLLKVRRGPHLLDDALVQLQNARANGALKQPLKVHFVGEQGVDEGGVQKELLQLLFRQLIDPAFGMFSMHEDTRNYWFRPSSLGLHNEFELVGILVGLAIFNQHIIEWTMPRVVYKRLLAQPVELDDLADVEPAVHRSLHKLLDMKGGVDELGLTFQVEQEGEFGGAAVQVDLVPGGGNVEVTAANRRRYVDAYVHHLLVTSIAREYEPFQRGFSQLCAGPALAMFRPEELEAVVCGSKQLHLEDLEAGARYVDGYTDQSQVVQWFWSVVLVWDAESQRRLLAFVTGSDRVPIQGLASLNPPFTISRVGPHSAQLPSAHTCFNVSLVLLLPEYESKQTLVQRLELATQHYQGFGLY